MNVRHLLPRTHEGYAACFAAAAAVIIVAALASMADAGGVRRAACAPHAVHQQAVVAAAIPYPVAGFQVGQYLQQQAVEEYAFRRSPSKERLTFLEGYYAAKQEEIQPAAVPQVDETSTCSDCEKPEEPQAFSAPLPTPAAPAAPTDFAASHPYLAAACAGCHSGETPKGDLNIAKAVVSAQANADCESLMAMVNAIVTGDMPKGKEMSEADRLNAIAELLNK